MTDVYDVIVQQLRVNRCTRIFDVGCGTGILPLRLIQSGLCVQQYKGLDRNPKSIEVLSKNGFDGQEGDLKWYDGMKFFWDTVVMKDVLEEMESIALTKEAILRARRVFLLATTAPLHDSLTTEGYSIDDVLALARNCSFQLNHFEQVGIHSVLVFTRKFKRRKS